MAFRILHSTEKEIGEWSMWISRLPIEYRDIHFLPEYGRIYEKTYGFIPLLFLLDDVDTFIIQPVVKRRLNDLPFLSELEGFKDYFDIANPYGYGGAVTSSTDTVRAEKLFQQFDDLVRNYCISSKLASEFICFHPLLENHKLFDSGARERSQRQKKIVYIDLERSRDEIWRDINRGHRSSISKAKRHQIRVDRIEPTDYAIMLFNRLYFQTMKRNQAASRWFFPEDYFLNCRDCLGRHNVSLHVAKRDGQVLSMYFLMHAFGTVYYHFGASDERFFELRPNNLLMYESILWAKDNGFKKFHLGGGVTSDEDDSLLRFKSGFSKTFRYLYTAARVHDSKTYEELCSLKSQYEIKEYGRLSTSQYFPAYRRS